MRTRHESGAPLLSVLSTAHRWPGSVQNAVPPHLTHRRTMMSHYGRPIETSKYRVRRGMVDRDGPASHSWKSNSANHSGKGWTGHRNLGPNSDRPCTTRHRQLRRKYLHMSCAPTVWGHALVQWGQCSYGFVFALIASEEATYLLCCNQRVNAGRAPKISSESDRGQRSGCNPAMVAGLGATVQSIIRIRCPCWYEGLNFERRVSQQ